MSSIEKNFKTKDHNFGSSPRKDERYAYVHQSDSARLGTPGKYVYEDNAIINRKKKVKYNAKGKNEYTSDVQRFPSPNERDMVPGPGTYIEIMDSSLSPLPRISDRGSSIE